LTVAAPLGDIALYGGSLLLGRLPECDVLLQGALVSRIHARISVQESGVVIEDLHSTNGVFVNGQRIGHSLILREGDRILIGTIEICLFQARDSSLSRVVSPTCQHTTAPESPLSRGLAGLVPKTAPPTKSQAPTLPSSEPVPTTARSDALHLIGSLAEQLAAAGDLGEAAQVLSGHLRRILKGANSGLAVPADVVDSASCYALMLARWTNQVLWADYVIELHIAARLVMTSTVLAQFEAVSVAFDFDRMLLGYYVEHPKGRFANLDSGERQRIERLRSWADR
jgi:predicted component of type VI protein secretion system